MAAIKPQPAGDPDADRMFFFDWTVDEPPVGPRAGGSLPSSDPLGGAGPPAGTSAFGSADYGLPQPSRPLDPDAVTSVA